LFNPNRAFFDDLTPAVMCSAKRPLIDRQRDIYDSHRHRIFSLAYYMIGNEAVAEETLGRTFLRAFQKSDEPDAGGIDTALMDELRQQMSFDRDVVPAQATPKDSLHNGNVRKTDLEEAIRELPELERLAYLLKDVEGYSTPAIAGLMVMPAPQVLRILMSARIRVRSMLAAKVAMRKRQQAEIEKQDDRCESPDTTAAA
jgi:RNA polymerase sigma-70 factor, ECF subfamily